MGEQILIVDDEQGIIDNVAYALTRDGFRVQSTALGSAAIELLRRDTFDLVVLDIGLPDGPGTEVCRRIRAFSNVPVIFLTARDAEVERIVGLELGADDYVTKPFSPRELVARIRAVLRRTQPAQVPDGGFRIDRDRRGAVVNGAIVELTPYEYGILAVLAARPGQVFSREQLIRQVWQDPLAANDRAVDTHVKTLRAKLAAAGGDATAVRTHRGFGYSFVTGAVS